MSTPMMRSAVAISAIRTAGGSSCAAVMFRGVVAVSGMALFAPAFEKVDQEERHERDHQLHHRDRGRLAVRELFHARDDHQRCDLGSVGYVVRADDDGNVLAVCALEGV